MSLLKKYGFLWVTLVLFVGSLAGHWTLAWYAYVDEQAAHNQPIEVMSYLVEVSRDTLENWQSEFLQLIWQVAGLTFLLYLNSPQSREGDERKEEKIDHILRMLDPEKAEKTISALDQKYPKK
jgi:hypothetical protein